MYFIIRIRSIDENYSMLISGAINDQKDRIAINNPFLMSADGIWILSL